MIYNGKEISFSDVSLHFWTGRAITERGIGGQKKSSYRTGVQTDIGDIEVTEWESLVAALIEEAGEQSLYDALVVWLREHNYAKEKEKDLRQKAYDLHASRIFDNELWVDFITFNERFRPGVTDSVEIVEIIPVCCGRIGRATAKQLNDRYNLVRGSVSCPHCGRFSKYTFPDGTAPKIETSDTWTDAGSVKPKAAPISATELAAGSERSVERVIPLLAQCGLKYRMSDFKYRTADGVLRNSSSVNNVSYLSYARKFVVTLSSKCPRMGKKLKKAIKLDREIFTQHGGSVIYQAVQFYFTAQEVLPNSPPHGEEMELFGKAKVE